MTIEADREDFENGLRIWARMIARAHLKNLARTKEINTEGEGNADQGNYRGHQVAEAGENQAGAAKGV
ncbi:MAG: hypothetical protein TUN42_07065 [Dehalogenimonas sp.]